MKRLGIRPLATAELNLAVLLWCLPIAAASWAGSLEVNSDSAYQGNFGLEVTVDSSCLGPTHLLLDSPPAIQGEFVGCSSLTAGAVQVVGSSTTFRAGDLILLSEGFSVAQGADFAAWTEEELSPFAWVGHHLAESTKGYVATFELRLDDLSLGDADRLAHLQGLSADGEVQFRITLKRNEALNENRLVLAARTDDGTFEETPFGEELMVATGWNSIAIEWQAAPSVGRFVVSLNDAPFVGLSDLDNGQTDFVTVRWGAVSGELEETSGSLDQDNFVSPQ